MYLNLIFPLFLSLHSSIHILLSSSLLALHVPRPCDPVFESNISNISKKLTAAAATFSYPLERLVCISASHLMYRIWCYESKATFLFALLTDITLRRQTILIPPQNKFQYAKISECAVPSVYSSGLSICLSCCGKVVMPDGCSSLPLCLPLMLMCLYLFLSFCCVVPFPISVSVL